MTAGSRFGSWSSSVAWAPQTTQLALVPIELVPRVVLAVPVVLEVAVLLLLAVLVVLAAGITRSNHSNRNIRCTSTTNRQIVVLLLMAEILHHLGCMKPYHNGKKLPINWCRISAINSRSTNAGSPTATDGGRHEGQGGTMECCPTLLYSLFYTRIVQRIPWYHWNFSTYIRQKYCFVLPLIPAINQRHFCLKSNDDISNQNSVSLLKNIGN